MIIHEPYTAVLLVCCAVTGESSLESDMVMGNLVILR